MSQENLHAGGEPAPTSGENAPDVRITTGGTDANSGASDGHTQRPAVVFFDIVETVLSLAPVDRALTVAGLGDRPVERWFGRLLRDAMALAANGDYAPFPEIARAAVESLLAQAGLDASASRTAPVMAALLELEAQPDAAPAMARLRSAGVRVLALSNGGQAATTALLERAGLSNHVEQVLSVEAVRAWKPRPEPYRYACEVAGLDASRCALVAVHSWDVHGAIRAGLLGGWCSRLERVYPSMFAPPTVTGKSLVDVCDRLLELPG